MSVAHLLKLVAHWSGYGEEGTISWHFVGNAADHTPTELSDAAGNVLSEWTSNEDPSSKTGLLSLLTSHQTIDLVTLYEFTTAPGPSTALGTATPSGWTGTKTSMHGPLQTCLVASLRTATPGASFRGRQYFPAFTLPCNAATAQPDSDDVDLVATTAANLGGDAAQAIASSLSISTLRWGVYSPTRGVCTEITSISVDNTMDTQRRREQSLEPSYVSVVTAP
jgi:hypothetical protein